MEFPVTIESQDEFDNLVKDRIGRVKTQAQAEAKAQFADYDELKAKAEQADARVAEVERERDALVTRAEEAEGKVATFEAEKQLEGWRAEVSKATGVPADVLRGSTKEEFEAHAETLKPLLTAHKGPVITSQGDIPDGSTTAEDDRAFADFLTGHRAD